jgi:hypothetical protein
MRSEPVSEPPYTFSVNLTPSGAPSFEPDLDFHGGGGDPFYARDVTYEVRDFPRIAAIPRHNDEEAP